MNIKEIIGIVIIILLMLGFILLFVLNRKTPIPKGCEDIEEKIKSQCSICSNELCEYKKRSEQK